MAILEIDGNSLDTANIVPAVIDDSSPAQKSFDIYEVAHANRSHIPFYNYKSKSIRIKGSLNHTSIANMDTLIDTFNGYFVGKGKTLDVIKSGGTRRYYGTAQAVSIDRPGGLMYAEFDVNFIATIPFGYDTTATSLASETGVTASPHNVNITVIGNAEFQYPVITVTLNSGTGLTSASMSIGNNANGQVATITRTWLAGDVVVIDPYNQIVTVNDDPTYFEGSLPIFETGAGAVTLTRDFDIDVDQVGFWL